MKSATLSQQKYMLIDFNCAHRSTHHWSSMAIYGKFINKHEEDFQFWTPKYIDQEIYKELSSIGSVLKILTSPQYGSTDFRRFPLSNLVTKISRLYSEYLVGKPLIGNQVKRIVTIYCIMPSFLRIVRESRSAKIHLVFPTLDYMGIQLIGLIEKYLSGLTIHVRRMGSETRSPFSTGEEFASLIKLVDSAVNNSIHLGIPTLGLLNEVRQKCRKPDQIHWSPLPPNSTKKSQHRTRNKVLNIGFPGTAKKSKGYSEIPKILNQLEEEGISVNVFLQKALYPWSDYLETRSKIFSSNHSIQELESVLSIDEYQFVLNQLDLIFLPYERDAYLNADSGILYEAADLRIPIFCPDNLGFSDEAFLNGFGFNINSSETMTELVAKAMSDQTQNNLNEYNNKRREALEVFLFGKR